MTLHDKVKSIWREWRTTALVLCAAVAAFIVLNAELADAGMFFYRSGNIPRPDPVYGPSCDPNASFTGVVVVDDSSLTDGEGQPSIIFEQWDDSYGFSITADNAAYPYFGTSLYVKNGQIVWAGGNYIRFDYLSRMGMSYNPNLVIGGPYPNSNSYETVVVPDPCYYFTYTPGTWSGASPLQTRTPKTLGGSSGVTRGGGSGGSVPEPAASLDNLGGCNNPCMKGNPINAATGNKFQVEEDFVGGANMLLALRRFYNSQDTTATSLGVGWRSTWHRTLKQVNTTTVTATRADGRVETYTRNASGLWQSDPDVTNRLVAVTGGWRLTTDDDNVESYLTDGRLASIATRGGVVITLAYDTANRLSRVADPFGHAMTFGYDTANRINQVIAPGGGLYKYDYDAKNNLASVTYPDGKVRRYVYDNLFFPNALTGIVDEKGVRFATWDYNTAGKAILSQHAGGVDKTTLVYRADGTVDTTDARGNTHTTALTTQFGMVKPTTVTGAPAPNAGGKAFTYHTNGFLKSRTDFNGNVTSYTHDARGNETSRTEAVGKRRPAPSPPHGTQRCMYPRALSNPTA